MNINSLGSGGTALIQKSFALAANSASSAVSAPVDTAVALTESEDGVKLGAKMLQVQDEMLGTIIDIKA